MLLVVGIRLCSLLVAVDWRCFAVFYVLSLSAVVVGRCRGLALLVV